MENIESELKYIKVNKYNLHTACKLQKQIFINDLDYDTNYKFLKEKIENNSPDDVSWIVEYNNKPIGVTGLYTEDIDEQSIWLDWYGVLPEYRNRGFGKKILLDTINYCIKLDRYEYLRLDTTYWEGRPAVYLYDSVMTFKEKYTAEDNEKSHNWWIYTYSLKGQNNYWNNKYLGLSEFYNKLKKQ